VDWLKLQILALQNFVLLSGRAFANITRRPHYLDDVILQMDVIGFGSLPIVLLTGVFSGATLALQMSRALNNYGAASEVGQIVSFSLVRELGPVLTALLVAGRNASGMASELGSMKVTEQIDAMRALGTDPTQKLVTPRLLATVFTLPLLTVLSDFIGILGGYIVSVPMLNLTTPTQYWSSAYQYLAYNDVAQGLIKPLLFGIIIALVGCYYGMQTTGGTQGVGRSTTRAVVTSSVWIFIGNLFITRFFVNLR
jgi:phospholipid/cholesterol/gamma-HCH transport system permease protein